MEGAPNEEVLLTELKTLLHEAQDEDRLKNTYYVQDEIVKKVKGLRKKYPDWQNYRVYHLLVGSDLLEPTKYFDFPGDDSIEKFIRSL
ncbi:MAG: hypothetical protein NTX96_00570 [Candidatus Zambryskibacteria bacterium]|nr:hypothetical protein [Candidatus Zambryskibacteria bacterium]